MSEALPGLDALELEDRRVLARVDINSPIEDGRVADNPRIRGAASSIRQLLDRGAGVVVLAHQGRAGGEDFMQSLDQHAAILTDILGVEVRSTPHIGEIEVLDEIEAVAPGDVLVLGNVRGAPGETEGASPSEHANRDWVRQLASVCDGYVNDAFPACHRNHASLVGLPRVLPSAAGPLLAAEVAALERVAKAEGIRIAIFGGTKVEDPIRVMAHMFEDDGLDLALLGGLVGELFIRGRGHDLGDATEAILDKTGALEYVDMVDELLRRFDPRIITPPDVGVDEGQRRDAFIEELPVKGRILDVGPATVEAFCENVGVADAVIVNGPLGMYEKSPFDEGTRGVLEAVASTDAWTVVGGGHTLTALERFGIDRTRFDHVSLAGGALITFLAGDPLPALEALYQSAHHFSVAQQG